MRLDLHDVGYAKAGGVARITLDRPHSLNSYTTSTLLELRRALEDATFDDRVGVIVLTGAGTQAFCTGGDVKEYAAHYTERPADYWKYMAVFRGALESILRCGKPTIARLNGITVGGGNEIHLACDLSVAGSHIYLGQVGVGVGSVACGGATQWLPLAVGDRRARAMLLLNERVPAPRALEWGLVNEVAPTVTRDGRLVMAPNAEEVAQARQGTGGYGIDVTALDRAVDALAQRLLAMFPECLRYTKLQTNFWKELAWNQTVGHGQEWLSLHFATREPHEGMGAFVEKRPARIRELREDIANGRSGDYLHGAPTARCEKCGARQLPSDFTFCGRCGTRLAAGATGAR
jgi:enoyl-CoA hydratase/carnithine racemase